MKKMNKNMIDLVSCIDSVTKDGNVTRIDFYGQSKDYLQLLKSVGITDITDVSEKSVVAPEYSERCPQQRKMLFELSCLVTRFESLKMLNAIGGFKLSRAEQKWFKEYNAEMARICQAHKQQNTK